MPCARAAQCLAVAQYSNALEVCQPNLLRQVYGASKTLFHKLFPATCLLCLDPGQPPALDLCRECEDDLPRNASACSICARPVANGRRALRSLREEPARLRSRLRALPLRIPARRTDPPPEVRRAGRDRAHPRHGARAPARRARAADGRCDRARAAASLARGAARLQPGGRDRALRRRSSDCPSTSASRCACARRKSRRRCRRSCAA